MRGGGRWLGLGLACALVATAFACRQIVGIEDEPEGYASASCGLSFTGACGQCLAAHCCEQAQACAALSSCNTYAACLAPCNGDLECRANCTVADVVGTPLASGVLASDLRGCLGTSCASECSFGCESNADYVAPPENARECGSCALARLCDPVSTDAGSVVTDASGAALDLFARCTAACTTPDCQQSCGPSVLDAEVGLFFGGCGAACAEGENWTCLDKLAWPLALASTSELLFSADPQHAGATTSVCARDFAGDCTTTLASGTIDDAGYSVMELPLYPGNPTPGPGFDGEYVYLSMPGDDAGALVPTLTYWGFPLSQPAYSVGTVVTSRDDLNALLASVDAGAVSGDGHVAAYVYDCRGAGAKNVRVELSTHAPETVAFNYMEGAPVRGDVTQGGNLVTFSNVPAGANIVVTATIAGQEEPLAELPVVVRPGAITVVNLVPHPM